jgi:hypothetical protein
MNNAPPRFPRVVLGSIRDRLITFFETGGGDQISYNDAKLMLSCTTAALSHAVRQMHEAGDVTVKTYRISMISLGSSAREPNRSATESRSSAASELIDRQLQLFKELQ